MSAAHPDLLLELGTEELPPTALKGLMAGLAEELTSGLEHAGIAFGDLRAYGSPRHLAVCVASVAERQPDRPFERLGPTVAAAFDGDGQPTNAAFGFARSCGAAVEALETVQTEKGARLAYRGVEPGRATASLLAAIVPAAVDRLALPRRMRWGGGEATFIRPVHWLVLMLGGDVVPAQLFGVEAGRTTRGHRFHHPQPIVLDHAGDYVRRLEEPGRVVVDFAERRQRVRDQAAATARASGGEAVMDEALLDEVTALVEWPVALAGSFDSDFLRVPEEALISSMQQHQRYFPIRDAEGALQPQFVAVANLASREPEQVRRGNERVIRPRLADAAFFWDQDSRHGLAGRIDALREVVFQERLGSLYDKSARIAALVSGLAEDFGVAASHAERAAWLAKTDLLTEMVGEFPELQGIMGRYYAQRDGETEDIASALEEVYWPRGAGDSIPSSALGRLLAVGERVDTLIGLFGSGQPPTGTKDPFGLRRAALGVLRIAVEGRHDLSLETLLERAAATYEAQGIPLEPGTIQAVGDFLVDRLRPYFHDRGVPLDVIDAVLARGADNPLNFEQRLRAVITFRSLAEAQSLALANKRIRNILMKAEEGGQTVPASAMAEALAEPAERALHAALRSAASEVVPLFAARRFEEGLSRLADLRGPVDRFFDTVMVMSEDPGQRRNRLALLAELYGLFLQVADLSRLQE